MSTATVPTLPPQVHDFDFLFGRWRVTHRRLTQRNAGSDDWDVFEGISYIEPRMGGICNVEEHEWTERGWRGVALRTLNLTTGEWAIYWIADRDGVMSAPVFGRFHQGGCRLEGPDMDGDLPIIALYEWSRTDTDRPLWVQHFSYDGGETWEKNWEMDFRRHEG